MRERNRRWAIACALLFVITAVALLVRPPHSSGTGVALACGIAAASTMIFAALLGLRKKLLRVRLGPISVWNRAHNWLGGLAFAFALFHSRFSTGGSLTTALMICLGLSALSGLFGALIQSILPSIMTSRLPDESSRQDLAPLFDEYRARIEELVQGKSALMNFHRQTVLPFLDAPRSPRAVLSSEAGATLAFEALRRQVDGELHEVVDRLGAICTEARHRADEVRLRRWLAGWELLHIPAALFALVLMIAHAFAALYY